MTHPYRTEHGRSPAELLLDLAHREPKLAAVASRLAVTTECFGVILEAHPEMRVDNDEMKNQLMNLAEDVKTLCGLVLRGHQ